jgi:hypothetical protein
MPAPLIAAALGRGVTGATAKRIAAALGKQAAHEQKLRLKTKVIVEWYDKQLQKKVNWTADQRVRIATALLLRQTKHNISRPVLKYKGIRSGRIQVLPESRSKPGEYPKAETTHLLKTTFSDVRPVRNKVKGIVGTPLDYGLLLETKMSRSFLRRTLHEMQPQLKRILVKRWWR